MKRNFAVLDTNVLLLWLVGLTDISLFETFKRVSAFDVNDFNTLEGFLKSFAGLITTPHVLTEVSNFVDQAPSHRRAELALTLRAFIEQHDEHYRAAGQLVAQQEFHLLGLADAGLVDLSYTVIVVTTDFRLAGQIEARGGNAINFNHLRSARLLARG